MASSSSSFVLLVLFLLSISSPTSSQSNLKNTPIHLHFYFHEKYRGANATSNVVATLNLPSSTFGNVVVFDNPLRQGPHPSSKVIGRAQGTAARASMGDDAALAIVELVFTEGDYKGSSVTIFGLVDASGSADRTITGGGGRFRMARGYALTKVVNSTASSLVAEYDVFVLDY